MGEGEKLGGIIVIKIKSVYVCVCVCVFFGLGIKGESRYCGVGLV